MENINTIFWDFDGVILDSQKVRVYGFKEIFKDFKKEDVDKLIEYHLANGGLSRFNKIQYFFNNILHKEISQEMIQDYANKFSKIMKNELVKKDYLILDSLKFIQNNYKKYNFHIASGSEDSELKFLCEKLEISKYFLSINGSPTPKAEIIKKILQDNNYDSTKCALIGDSIHDYYAANANKINFYGYNNEALKDIAKNYIISFY